MCLLSWWKRKQKKFVSSLEKVWEELQMFLVWQCWTAPPLLPLFNPGESHQRCDEVLPFWCRKDPAQQKWPKTYIVYTILNGGVVEVTRRLGHSTVWNGQTVPKLSKPYFFYALPFYTAIYSNVHNIKFAHNGLMVQGLYLCSTLDCPKPSTLLTCEISMDTSLSLRLAISCSVWSFCSWQTFRWFIKAMFFCVRSILFHSEFFNSSSNSWTRDSSSPLSVASFIFPSLSSSASSSTLGGKLSSCWAKVKERV